jgi:DNA-binding NarL/FixJ family response regulator
MKTDERTKRIPVVILTTTDDPREVARCYELGCNVYITKPVDYEQFSESIRKLGLFLMVVMIPDGVG